MGNHECTHVHMFCLVPKRFGRLSKHIGTVAFMDFSLTCVFSWLATSVVLDNTLSMRYIYSGLCG